MRDPADGSDSHLHDCDCAGVPHDTDLRESHLRETFSGQRETLSTGWLELRRDTVSLPDGSTATREYIRHPGAVAIIPLLDDGRVVMVRQFRYPVGKVLLEVPAGKRDAGESLLGCAARELVEETGYRATEWAFACEIHNAAAYATESIWLYFARGLVAGPQRLDQGEFVEVVSHSEAELDAMQAAGLLPDVKTVIGLHFLQRWRAGARTLEWLAAPTIAP